MTNHRQAKEPETPPRKIAQWPNSEKGGGGVHTEGGPDAIEGGAWGTYEPYMADLELYLADLKYPVSRDQLVEHVRNHGAPEMVAVTLAQLPDQQFASAADITLGLEQIE